MPGVFQSLHHGHMAVVECVRCVFGAYISTVVFSHVSVIILTFPLCRVFVLYRHRLKLLFLCWEALVHG